MRTRSVRTPASPSVAAVDCRLRFGAALRTYTATGSEGTGRWMPTPSFSYLSVTSSHVPSVATSESHSQHVRPRSSMRVSSYTTPPIVTLVSGESATTLRVSTLAVTSLPVACASSTSRAEMRTRRYASENTTG